MERTAERGLIGGTRLGRFERSVLLAFAVACVATLVLPAEIGSAIGAITMAFGFAAAGVLILRKLPGMRSNERLPWRLYAYGLVLISSGLWVMMAVIAVSGYDAAYGPPDLLFLIGYATGMTGLAIMPNVTGDRLQRSRLVLDGITGAVALAALFWVFFYSEIVDVLTDAPAWDRIVGSLYPLFDLLMLVTIMIVIVRRSASRYDPRFALIALGAIAQAIADVAFLLSGVGRSFSEANPLFPFHLLAVASLFAAAAIVDRPIEAREYADRPATPLWALIVPYGTAGLMVGVLILRIDWTTGSTDDAVLLFATLLVGITVLIRQGVAIKENRQFVEAQRTALAASISHELRTPLTAMVGFLDLLERKKLQDPAEETEVLSIVTDQAAHLTGIVSDLVMLASGNSTIELTVAAIRLDKLAWASVNGVAVDPSLIRVNAEPEATAYVDEARMRQSVGNLLSNAVRYGGDRIELTTYADSGDLVIEVHDNGPGVPRKHELAIWEKFERGPNRLNATVPGSGIGLAITKAIALAHGGVAGYRRSLRLGGACFWIRLPARIQSAPARADQAQSASSTSEETQTA